MGDLRLSDADVIDLPGYGAVYVKEQERKWKVWKTRDSVAGDVVIRQNSIDLLNREVG